MKYVALAAACAALLACPTMALGQAPATAEFTYAPASPTPGQQVTFTAQASGDEPLTYRWEDDTPDGPGFNQILLGTGNPFQFTFQKTGSKYVRLNVTDADGSTATVMHTVTVATAPPAPDTTPPTAPTGVTATAGDAQATIRWTASTDNVAVTHYRLVVDGTERPANITGTTSTLTGLTNGRAYSIQVRAFDAAGNTATSTAVTVTPTAGTPPPPPPSGEADPMGTVFFRGDFEGGLGQWSLQHCPPVTSITPRTDGARQGTGYARMTVTGGGPCFNDRTWRAEPHTIGRYSFKSGDVRYYKWSTRFPAGFPNLQRSHCNFMQWKDATGGPPLSMWCDRGIVSVDNSRVGGWTAPMRPGAGWHDFVMKVLHAQAGYVELWYRAPGQAAYSKVIPHAARTTLGDGSHYLKQGYYRGSAEPAGTDPWLDQDGMVVSACNTIDPAC